MCLSKAQDIDAINILCYFYACLDSSNHKDMRGWGVTFWYLEPPSESNFLGKRNEEPGFISGYIYLTNYLDNFITAPKQNPKQTTQ